MIPFCQEQIKKEFEGPIGSQGDDHKSSWGCGANRKKNSFGGMQEKKRTECPKKKKISSRKSAPPPQMINGRPLTTLCGPSWLNQITEVPVIKDWLHIVSQ